MLRHSKVLCSYGYLVYMCTHTVIMRVVEVTLHLNLCYFIYARPK